MRFGSGHHDGTVNHFGSDLKIKRCLFILENVPAPALYAPGGLGALTLDCNVQLCSGKLLSAIVTVSLNKYDGRGSEFISVTGTHTHTYKAKCGGIMSFALRSNTTYK